LEFKNLKLSKELLEGLDAMNFIETTPIQELTIPIIMEGKDVVACAQTGTGKTAAYILPILNNIITSGHKGLNTLVLAPTRELAQQIDQQIDGFAYFVPVSSISIYGGGDGVTWEQQRRALDEGVDMIIATPGRLLSFLTLGNRKLPELKHLVLDEADRMLDMGFYDDIVKIVKNVSVKRQTMLFSATMPYRIRQLAKTILNDPKEVNIAISKPAEGITQQAYMVYDNQKERLIEDILKDTEINTALIFASTKEKVKLLQKIFRKKDDSSEAFHSDLEQKEREEILRRFKSKKLRIIIGTDVLSRGIDVEGIDLVINYDVPPDPEDYVHRVGRTARAEREGKAITFINDHDLPRLHKIESLIGYQIPRTPLPEDYGKGPEYQKTISKGKSRNHKSKRKHSHKHHNKKRH